MQERGVFIDHSSINRWAIRFLPLLEEVFRQRKHPVGGSWRMDETDIKVKRHLEISLPCGRQTGQDGFLSAKLNMAAARRFFDKAMQANDVPETVTMDRSGANKAAIDEINANSETMLSFKSF